MRFVYITCMVCPSQSKRAYFFGTICTLIPIMTCTSIIVRIGYISTSLRKDNELISHLEYISHSPFLLQLFGQLALLAFKASNARKKNRIMIDRPSFTSKLIKSYTYENCDNGLSYCAKRTGMPVSHRYHTGIVSKIPNPKSRESLT